MIKKKWLITGAAGFIGSNIVKKLIDGDQEVWGIDNFSTGNYENIREYINDFTFYEGDIRNQKSCDWLCSNVDYVLHQAALGSVPRSIDAPYNSHDSNVSGFLTLLVAARDAGVEHFVYASSGSVYGDDDSLPKVEGIEGEPLSPYAATKVMNEGYAKVFHKVYGFNSTGLRYFNVYGPNQQFEGAYVTVIPIWSKAFIKGKKKYIYGDGETSRDFCYVDDVVQSNLLAAMTGLKGANIFNVGAGERFSLNELFLMIRDRFDDSKSEPIYEDFRVGDTRHTLADLTSIRNKLGYEPKYNIHTGLDKAIEWYKENVK